MPRIVLKDLQTEKTYTVQDIQATIGRDPASSVVVQGENSRVVSGHHARILHADSAWWIEDTSRNGTVVDNERLRKGERHPLRVGQTLGLGESGPRLRVLALEARNIPDTMVEEAGVVAPPGASPVHAPEPSLQPAASDQGAAPARRSQPGPDEGPRPEEPTEPSPPGTDWIVHIVLRDTQTDHRWDVKGEVVKLGRSPECLVQIAPEQGASVSRVHAEVLISDGGVQVRDAGSRNGTYVNGERLLEPRPFQPDDQITLGVGGPTFSVEELHIIRGKVSPLILGLPRKSAGARPQESADKSGVPSRALGAAAQLARRSFSGVGRTAFFRDILDDMSARNARRVRVIVWASVAATVLVAGALLHVTQRRVAETERQLQEQRTLFETRADSIHLAATRQVEASRAALAEVARANQGAVGLVTAHMQGGGMEGTGFAITPSGYFITNRHMVVRPDGGRADSVFVTMADNPYGSALRADIVGLGQGDDDIALLRLRGYQGPHVGKLTWTFASIRQGEPAALIGFPHGVLMARDRADTVRTSMNAGIFSKVTPTLIQFDGFSQGGSSGSPVFSANGEVVAVHFAGLKGTLGIGFALPLERALPLLPPDARSELGIK